MQTHRMAMADQGGEVGDAVLLMDPHWVPTGDGPPADRAVAGHWPLGEDGTPGPFRSNPAYEPVDPGLPGDPVDALLRLCVDADDLDLEQLRLLLRGVLVLLATDGQGRPLVVDAPDGVPCLLVATSGQHQRRAAAPGWRQVDLAGLVAALADGVDVLVNPGGPAGARLGADFLRGALLLGAAELAAAAGRFGGTSSLDVVGWPPGSREGA